MTYSKKSIVDNLTKAGIKSNDTVFFTTSLGMVGNPPENINSQEELNKLFLDALRELLKDGNILIPTYSYTFGESTETNPAIFDLQNTICKIGSFPNYVLSQSDVIRSKDPFVSVACIGRDSDSIFRGLSNHSYGEGSFFERMVNSDSMKCCSIGLGPNWTPFIHYADWLAKVPHRYDKEFYGFIKNQEDINLERWIYSVPFIGKESYSTAHNIGRLAEKLNIWKSHPLGRSRIYVANCKEYFTFAMKQLEIDKWCFATGPSCDVTRQEKERLKDIEDIQIDSSYQQQYVNTGDWIDDWIAPERWTCQYAKLSDKNGNVLSTTPYDYSLSIDKIVSVAELKKHLSSTYKNVYNNRDWGFIYNGELKESEYKVQIKSSFGYGSINILTKNHRKYALLNNRLVEFNDR